MLSELSRVIQESDWTKLTMKSSPSSRFSAVVASFVARTSCSTLSPVSAGMGNRLWAGIPPWYVTNPTRSTQPCIPQGSLNRVPALIGWGKGGNVTSAGWQVTLCDPIWHGSSRSSVVLVAQTAIHFLTLPYLTFSDKLQCLLRLLWHILEMIRPGGGAKLAHVSDRAYEGQIHLWWSISSDWGKILQVRHSPSDRLIRSFESSVWRFVTCSRLLLDVADMNSETVSTRHILQLSTLRSSARDGFTSRKIQTG